MAPQKKIFVALRCTNRPLWIAIRKRLEEEGYECIYLCDEKVKRYDQLLRAKVKNCIPTNVLFIAITGKTSIPALWVFVPAHLRSDTLLVIQPGKIWHCSQESLTLFANRCYQFGFNNVAVGNSVPEAINETVRLIKQKLGIS